MSTETAAVTDILIVGGGLGGVAAAPAALDRGRSVLLAEETDWIGGRLTSQGVPPDEHAWIEQFGATRTYRALREAIRDHYRTWYPLTDEARRRRLLNPGEGRVSALCHEPRVAAAVLEAMVTPMDRPGRPSAPAADAPLGALAAAGAHGLMPFGSNGEGPLLPTTQRGDFAAGVAGRWCEPTCGGPVLVNITAPGTAEALARAEAVLPAEPDALVLSPPIYYHHRHDEIGAHYAATAGPGVPVVAYNAPRYSNPLTPALLDERADLAHLVGIEDSSGDLALFGRAVAAARRRDDFGVSQGAEGQALDVMRLGSDGLVPGEANLLPGKAVELFRAHREGRDGTTTRGVRDDCSTRRWCRTPYGPVCGR